MSAMTNMSDTPRPRLRYCPVAPFFQCCSSRDRRGGGAVYDGVDQEAAAADTLYCFPVIHADSQMMAWIGRDRIFDRIRSEPRFVALVKKMGIDR